MKKKQVLIALFAAVALTCTACGPKSSPQPSYSEVPQSSQEPEAPSANTQAQIPDPITTSDGTTIEFEQVTFDNFSLAVPKDFTVMDDEILAAKYPSENPPTRVYTNTRGTVNIALSMNDTELRNEHVKACMDALKSSYEPYALDGMQTTIAQQSGHNIGEIRFLSAASDTDIYNHFLIFSVNDKLRIINFNCTRELMEDWSYISDVILTSLLFT